MKKINLWAGILVSSILVFACTQDPKIDLPPDPDPDPPANPDSICHLPIATTLQADETYSLVLDTLNNIRLDFSIEASPEHIVRILPLGCFILDSEGFNYPDALYIGQQIGPQNNWTDQPGVLGTSVSQAGAFEGRGERFLGFRFTTANGGQQYGWVRLICAQGNASLEIIDAAFTKIADLEIWAGQKASSMTPPSGDTAIPITSVLDLFGNYRDHPHPDSGACHMVIRASADPNYDFEIQYFTFMWPFPSFYGHLVNGSLVIPATSFSGNIPSPGGTPRPYEGVLAGTGALFLDQQLVKLLWDIDYDKTGFMAESYHGDFFMYKCD